MSQKLLAHKNLVLYNHKLGLQILHPLEVSKFLFFFFYLRELLSKQRVTLASQMNQCSSSSWRDSPMKYSSLFTISDLSTIWFSLKMCDGFFFFYHKPTPVTWFHRFTYIALYHSPSWRGYKHSSVQYIWSHHPFLFLSPVDMKRHFDNKYQTHVCAEGAIFCFHNTDDHLEFQKNGLDSQD